jgi:hypothetical protein
MPHPLKRARTDTNGDTAGPCDNPDASTPKVTRHPELWFDDGSVVLKAETTLFRVHRTTLSTHSTVFSDMFGISHPPDKDDVIEGYPMVHLPDLEEDVGYPLKALYNIVSFLSCLLSSLTLIRFAQLFRRGFLRVGG